MTESWTVPTCVMIERSFVLDVEKPKVDQPYKQTVPLFTCADHSSGHLWFSNITLDIFALSGVYFALFKAPASSTRPDEWTSFVYPTKPMPAVADVTVHTRNIILSGVCSGSTGQVTSYHSSLRVCLGSRDQVFVILGFPNSGLWEPSATSVAMSLTGLLSPLSLAL
jgi:hypothetical protein